MTFLFTLGNSSNSFLLLRAYDAGFSSNTAILLYFIYNVTASILATPCGKLSDKVGRKKLLVTGYLTFSVVYFGFAVCTSKPLMIVIFVIYGIYTALTAGVERAFYIGKFAPKKGNEGELCWAYIPHLAGIALLPASVIAGLLWDNVGTFAPFVYGGVMSLVAAVILMVGLKQKKER